MKLAVMKMPGHIIGGGYHYFLHPQRIEDKFQEECFSSMGHIIIEVTEERGEELLKESGQALLHQINIAALAYAAETKELKP